MFADWFSICVIALVTVLELVILLSCVLIKSSPMDSKQLNAPNLKEVYWLTPGNDRVFISLFFKDYVANRRKHENVSILTLRALSSSCR